MEFQLAFIGFGVVGQGLAEILVKDKERLTKEQQFNFKVVAISDKVKGSIFNEHGLDLGKVLSIVKDKKSLETYDEAQKKGWDSVQTIKESNANVIIEVSWTDINTGEPALTHVKTALELKKHVVMTNKGPISLAVNELLALAKKNNVQMKFEGTVLSGTPAINLGLNNLAGAGVTEVLGIVNGTTNYILTEMEKGLGYAEALKQAQELGYAEADPSGDVEGWDAVGKVVIITSTIMNHPITKTQVEREGITKITKEDIAKATKEGMRWKLIASSKLMSDGSVKASVKPLKLPLSNPLANVMGPINALTFKTTYLGDVTIVGPGAGKEATGFSLLADLLEINRSLL
jgi:homoserine dehydrogenase